MSEQIREQVSAFLDGELPNTETELLLKRLTRDAELRESFGRFALIGEAVRGASEAYLTKGFATRVNSAIDGEVVQASGPAARRSTPRWWRPLAGTAVAASVAAVAVFALQQRAVAPTLRAALPIAATLGQSGEALSYTVPAANGGAPASVMPAGRLTNYVFAHSKYSTGLGRRAVLADLLIEDDQQPQAVVTEAAAHVAP